MQAETLEAAWLSAKGESRTQAVVQAAQALLQTYERQWHKIIPVDLHRLADTRSARIVSVPQMRSGAKLLPVPGGFSVLVSDRLPQSKWRTSVAHELVHTLFYSSDPMPERLFRASNSEEFFCYDVARRLLAPEWIMENLGFLDESSATKLFAQLRDRLQLTRLVAARVMLSDYRLREGVGAHWSMTSKGWKMEPGRAVATNSLDQQERRRLHSAARSWLLSLPPPRSTRVIGTWLPGRKRAFVLALRERVP